MFYLISVQVICDIVWILNVFKIKPVLPCLLFYIFFIFTKLSISIMHYAKGVVEHVAQWLYIIGHRDWWFKSCYEHLMLRVTKLYKAFALHLSQSNWSQESGHLPLFLIDLNHLSLSYLKD